MLTNPNQILGIIELEINRNIVKKFSGFWFNKLISSNQFSDCSDLQVFQLDKLMKIISFDISIKFYC
ncbi:hypothetical protein pb186bvf_015560 [Paramecium bursaria]